MLAASTAGRASAQQPQGPILLLQPGLLSANFVSVPEGVSSTSGFNLRFATRIATSSRWITPILGVSVTPYGTSGISERNTNAPALFAGNVFPVLDATRTAGWLTLEIPVLVYHWYGGGSATNSRIYGRDVFLQLAAYFHLGRKALGDLGSSWTRVDAYVFLEQNLMPNEDGTTGLTDRFNPVAMFGLSISIGGRGGEPGR